jgi:16S rRNA (guanine966-N2)-methyltransferase
LNKRSRFSIISGKFKNHPLKAPKSQKTRPTTALLRKSVFDILRPSIEGSSFLDLYAGSGAMGLEALSQGASHATFVESSKEALLCIQENIRTLCLKNSATILFGNALAVIKKLPKESFDILYADPPYSQAKDLLLLLAFLDVHPLVKKGGLIVLEEGSPSQCTFPLFKTLIHKDTRGFGKSLLHQFLYN